MQVAKIENSVIVEVLDTSRPELFPDFVAVPDHVHAGMDLRFYDEQFMPLPESVLIERGLIEPSPTADQVEDDEPESLTYEQRVEDVNNMRRFAYSDPLSGSDALFAQYQRMLVMNESSEEAELVKAAAIARYEAIRAEYPWPEADPV